MKPIVRLVVSLSTLLLITGVALSQDCKCYSVTLTAMDGSNEKNAYYDLICLDYEKNSGTITSGDFSMDLSLFFDYIPNYMIGSGSGCVSFFNSMGSSNTVIIGMEACGSNRARFYGVTVDMGLCQNPT
jgi:hypothetical protein